MAAWVDGEPLVGPEAVAFDPYPVQDRIESDRGFSLITCWCGVPECAGVDEPIEARHEHGVVRWLHTYDSLTATSCSSSSAMPL